MIRQSSDINRIIINLDGRCTCRASLVYRRYLKPWERAMRACIHSFKSTRKIYYYAMIGRIFRDANMRVKAAVDYAHAGG